MNIRWNEMEKTNSEKFKRLKEFIDSVSKQKGNLISVLHKGQEIFGYLPKDVILYISRSLNIPAAEVYGVVSFYSFFNMNKVGENIINVCMGTACFVRGADKILNNLAEKLKIQPGETTPDGKFTLKDVRCIGACGLAPIFLVGKHVYGNTNEKQAIEIIEKYME